LVGIGEIKKTMSKTILKTIDLCKTFPGPTPEQPLHVLRDINIEIAEGDIYGVIGRSGAGKSTFVRCVNYLERPTSGEIIFERTKLSALSNKALYKARQSMGMIFQQFNLLQQRTALKNVCFPLEIAGWDKHKARERAANLLEVVGMGDKKDNYPAQLSGGQKQRVAIARAIALHPKILLCDESTSALDPETTRSVLALLKDINREFKITIVVITHEMQVIESICSHVAIIDKSRIVESGQVYEVFSKPKSEVAKKLIYAGGDTGERIGEMQGKRLIRIVFNGNSSCEPVIADLVLRFRQKVNIVFADTNDIGGKAYGQMILQLPEDTLVAAAMREHLDTLDLTTEEVNNHVFSI
jgi:D-methionine transport system ATP-binding protein